MLGRLAHSAIWSLGYGTQLQATAQIGNHMFGPACLISTDGKKRLTTSSIPESQELVS